MASFGCYDNSDVIATRIITNFHLYLIQLWWQFFQMFVYGVVVYAQKKLHRYWPWKTVLYLSHFHMLVRPMLLHRMALVSVRLFCKNLGNLQDFFGQMVYRPPWQKIARTPMPDPDLQIRGRGQGVVSKKFLGALRSKNRGRAPRAPPLDPPLLLCTEYSPKDLTKKHEICEFCSFR